jgi:hypothetical protein
MGVQIPVNGSEATIRWSLAGDSEFMVVTLGLLDQTLVFDPEDIADRFDAAFTAGQMSTAADMGVGWSLGTKFVKTILPSGPVTIEVGTAISNTGTHSTPPNNCAVLVRKQTALGGRENRGRMYLPPFRFGEGDWTPTGILLTANVATIQAELNAFLTALDNEGLSPVLWHSDGSAGTLITGLVCQARLATQRTRMRR